MVEKIHVEILRRKRHMGQMPGETKCRLPGVLAQCRDTGALTPSHSSAAWVPKVCTGAQSHRFAGFSSGRLCQGLRVHFLGTSLGPVLKTGLSWNCAAFEGLSLLSSPFLVSKLFRELASFWPLPSFSFSGYTVSVDLLGLIIGSHSVYYISGP